MALFYEKIDSMSWKLKQNLVRVLQKKKHFFNYPEYCKKKKLAWVSLIEWQHCDMLFVKLPFQYSEKNPKKYIK